MKKLLLALVVLVALAVLYVWAALNWSYSSGERAGWVQKLSKKGWVCKTWEGEMAMVAMPGAMPEKFFFTITDDAVAEQVNRLMGRRASLHYEERVGLPTSCFGDTRHYVTGVRVAEEIGALPALPAQAAPSSPPAPSTTSAPATPTSPSTVPAPSAQPSPVPPPAAAPAPAGPAASASR